MGATAATAATAGAAATAGTAFATGLAAVGAATAVAGAGVSAYGQYQAGKAASALADYNAKQGEINAQAAGRDASIQANQMRAKNRLIEGKQYAAYSASGVVGDTGSPLMQEMSTHANLEIGALEAEREGGIEAGKDLQQAELDRIGGKNTMAGAKMGTAATLISGLGSATSGYASFKRGK